MMTANTYRTFNKCHPVFYVLRITSKTGTIIIPISPVRKLRHRVVK